MNPTTSARPVPIYAATPDTIETLLYGAPESPVSELVVLYFWGPDCPNCEFFAEHLPALLGELAGAPMRLVKANAYEHPALATGFAVHGIPAFFLFRDGKKIGRMSEFRGRRFFTAVIREHLPTSTDSSGS